MLIQAQELVLGTLTGALLMTAAKLGTPPPVTSDTVADAPFEGGPDDPSTPGPGATVGPTTTGAPGSSAGPQPEPGSTGTPPIVGTGTTPPAPPPAGLKSGTFAGSAVTHKYGTLQITIVVSGGAISDIRWTYQTSLPLSENINADALPKLRSEALSVQSAQVHTVSGATYTSGAYRTSLQSAIDKAK